MVNLKDGGSTKLGEMSPEEKQNAEKDYTALQKFWNCEAGGEKLDAA